VNNKGWGLNEMLGVLAVLGFALIIVAILYGRLTKSFQNVVPNETPMPTQKIETEKEEENDKEFSKSLASLAEVYVNDAFGTAHRAHSSTAGVSEFLPSVSGFLIEKEIKFLGEALNNPERPFVAIIGGKKVSDKITVINNLLEKVDTLIIGGGMAYTFLKAKGINIGDSICEEEKLDLAKELMEKANAKNVNLLLPVDVNVAKEFSENAENKIVSTNEIENRMARIRYWD